jgi:adenylate kinase
MHHHPQHHLKVYMMIVLFGPPAAGKGTQSAMLAKQYNIPAFSTGDMFRAAIAAKTPVGREVKSVMERGDLVGDDLVNKLVFERLDEPDCANGVILDGYPRTVAQAQALDAWLEDYHLKLDKIFELVVDEKMLVQRRAGRLYAPQSKCVYHITFNPPKVAGICDESGEPLIQREDDQPAVVQHRLEVYREQTSPVIAYYKAQNRHVAVDGMAGIEAVNVAIQRGLAD